jgi:membrane protein involved in colicin uptake
MAEQPYDPAKRKERYERTKQLKGHTKGASKASSRPSHSPTPSASPAQPVRVSQERVVRVRTKLNKLKTALSDAEAELSSRRQKERAEKKKSSDGKSTASEKKASQDYRDKHQTELASKSKASSKSSGGGSKSSSNSVADMSTQDLQARITKIRGAITVARRLLSSASLEHGQLVHSAIVSDPNVNERFARFQSAERGPST